MRPVRGIGTMYRFRVEGLSNRVLAGPASDKSSSRADWRSLCALVQPLQHRTVDSTKENARCPLVSVRIRTGVGAGEGRSFSPYRDGLANGLLGNPPQGVFPTILEDELNGVTKAGEAFGLGSALPVSTGNLGTESDEPITIALDNRCEFVGHSRYLSERRYHEPLRTRQDRVVQCLEARNRNRNRYHVPFLGGRSTSPCRMTCRSS